MPYNIFPGDQDWQSKVSWGGIFGRPPPIGNGPVIPTATPPTGSWADKLVSRLNSPGAQLGLRILANNRAGNSVGNNLGQSFLGYQQDQAQQEQAALQRQLMQAQIAKMQQPQEDNSAPMIVTGPDGKPRYVSRKDAIGRQPYQQPSGESNGPGELAIAQALNDPNTPESVKRDLRDLLERKYPGPQAQEPLIAIQGPNGPILVPRSQATNATPAASREAPSETELTAKNYFDRMNAAEGKLGSYVPSYKDYIAAGSMMSGGGVSGPLANSMLSPQGQSYYQAAADWVRAKLRKESGAVISPAEMAQEIKTYFPMPGDGEAVIAQKAKSRQQATSGMRDMGGRASKQNSAPAATPQDPLGIR